MTKVRKPVALQSFKTIMNLKHEARSKSTSFDCLPFFKTLLGLRGFLNTKELFFIDRIKMINS